MRSNMSMQIISLFSRIIKNIILAANQAAMLLEDKDIIVIPTKTIPQGISAMINFIPEQSPEENRENMLEAIAAVKTDRLLMQCVIL